MSTKQQCPNFPYFGASYPDACCIDGSLHDLDDCTDEGEVYLKDEDFPCPFCRPQDAYQRAAEDIDYVDWDEDGETDEMYEQRMDLQLRQNINAIRERYGFPSVTFTPIK